MTHRRRRWWIFRPLTRNPLSRPVDRIEGWAVVLLLVTLIAAAFVAVDVSESVEVSETAVIQREHATRHPVQAVAVGPTEKQQQGTATVFRAHIRWFDGTETHDRTIRVPRAVAAGDRVDIWIDGSGNLKPEPRATSAAAATGFGTGALLWFAVAALAGGLLAVLRRLLDRRRFRAWDQALAEFAGRGGGWNAHNP